MLKHNIWHIDHTKKIIMTKQIYIYINLLRNFITRIPRTVKKVFLQNLILFRERKSFCISKNFLIFLGPISLSFL